MSTIVLLLFDLSFLYGIIIHFNPLVCLKSLAKRNTLDILISAKWINTLLYLLYPKYICILFEDAVIWILNCVHSMSLPFTYLDIVFNILYFISIHLKSPPEVGTPKSTMPFSLNVVLIFILPTHSVILYIIPFSVFNLNFI